MSIILLILGLLLFVGLVVVHEFGHFIMARRGGVEVEEFGIGFPPRARVITKKNGTVYTLNWLPLGGFVKLKGENDADKSPGSFGAATLSTKIKVMLAGVVMNLLTAFALLTFLALIGMPKLVENQFTVAHDTKVVRQDVLIGYVEPDSPAGKAGLQQRDKLVSLTGPVAILYFDKDGKTILSRSYSPENITYRIATADALPNITKQYADQTVTLGYRRDGAVRTTQVHLRGDKEVADSKKSNNPKGYLGIAPTEYILQRSTWSAPIVAVGFMKQVTVLTLKGLGNALAGLFQGNTGKASAQVSGPVGIFVLLKDGSLLGYQFVLMIIAIISLTLAIMNVLPIPALDGGRLFVTLVFRTMRKPLKAKTENLIHGTGFAVLMLLFVVITFVDVKRFF